MDLKSIAKTLADIGLPALGAALPLPGGMALGSMLAAAVDDHLGTAKAGQPPVTMDNIVDVLTQNAQAKEAALEFQARHQETILKIRTDAEQAMYAAETADRDSARKNNVAGGTQKHLFWLSLLILVITMGSEIAVLFYGYPKGVPDLVVGRVLGLMDAVAMTVLAYWYGSGPTQHQQDKTT